MTAQAKSKLMQAMRINRAAAGFKRVCTDEWVIGDDYQAARKAVDTALKSFRARAKIELDALKSKQKLR